VSTVTRDITTEQAVRTCLERAARPMSPTEIASWCMARLSVPMQTNTLVKNLKFLRDKGLDIRKQERGNQFEYSLCTGISRGAASGGVAVDSAAPRHVYRQHETPCDCLNDHGYKCGSYWTDHGQCTRCRVERAAE
jgi:hypothetical protein